MCHLVHEVQNYWVEVLGQQLEEKDDRHWEVDNEEGHSNYVPLSAKLLSQRIGVVYIVAGTIHDEPARIEREDEGNESEHYSQDNTTLLEGVRYDCQCCSSHAVPCAEDCHERSMFSLLID